MEQDKTKILSDLYAIRATMSVVAMNDDEAEVERGALVAVNDEQSQADEMIRESENALGAKLYEKRQAVQEQMEELQNKYKDARSSYGYHKNGSKHSFMYYIWDTLWDHVDVGCLLGVILVILSGVGLLMSFTMAPAWIGTVSSYWEGVLYNVFIYLSAIFAFLFLIVVPIAGKQRNNDKKWAAQEWLDLQLIEGELNKVTELYAAYSEHLNETSYSWQNKYHRVSAPKYHRPEIDGLIKSHENKVAECESRKTELEKQKGPHNETIVAIAQKSQKIIDSAVKTYPLIDFRDWENVDLLIYYFETGRADDMKEALQLVDRQRQMDQITRAIAMASKEICRTFDDSMRRLGSALSQSFGVLSKQMAQQHVELMAGMERQAKAQIREIRAQTAEQRNTQAMNRALLEKISDSSLELAEQMDRQIKEAHGIY